MTINELRRALEFNLNTWDVDVLVEGKEIESVGIAYSKEIDNLCVEIKLKK